MGELIKDSMDSQSFLMDVDLTIDLFNVKKIIILLNIGRRMANQNHKSLTTYSNSIKNKEETNNPSIFQAFNKLKYEQDKLIQENKRYKVLNLQISKEQTVLYNRQKQNQFFQSVRQSANIDKEIKNRYQKKQIEELKQRYTTNMKNRQQHKKMIQNVRKSFNQANHELYEQIKQKKIQNQQLIKTQRNKHIQSRVVNRIQANKEKDIRRRSIQNFYQSRSKERIHSKSKEIQEIMHTSEVKHMLYDAMLTRNSRIRQNKIKSSRLSSTVRSDRSPQTETITAQAKS